ncbi:MAG: type I glutamate--ammonia ligase [Methylacidiphilales bacterium]|nr:type I glutamate--ammonia ligase [Candidatus Methylacidiphilales bacterium]
MKINEILSKCKSGEVKFVDLRFTDTIGKEQHVTIPSHHVEEELFTKGKPFDGSSIAGWLHINESDMILLPDLNAKTFNDPFRQDSTLIVRCDVLNPRTNEMYHRDPRTIAKKAEKYLNESGVADTAFLGPEAEFFIFDDVRWEIGPGLAHYKITSQEAEWMSNSDGEDGNNHGHRPLVKGGYFPVPPVDSFQDMRSEMCNILEQVGLEAEVHHHEVATAGQCEIGTKFNTLVLRADENQIFKYVVQNVAHEHGKTATFMPKPLLGDNGSGMHVHISLQKGDKNIFFGNVFKNLSQEALYFIGGIFKHIKAVNAFTNASTNSYRRLVPGFEAPVLCAYSAHNRSASIRIPVVTNLKATRIEIRFPDSTGNPYLAFTALLMAGLDGIKNKIDPGPATDLDLYELTREQKKQFKPIASDLADALLALDQDRDFLKAGGVMSDDTIDGYIELKQKEVDALRLMVSPYEIKQYYSL